MEQSKCSCSCSETAEKVVMCCSGASDVGQISDLVARKFRDSKERGMKCLTMVAIDNKPLIESLKTANVLVIDGCPIDCGKKIMDRAGITNYAYMRVTDHGLNKGASPANEANVAHIHEIAKTYC